MLQIIAAQLSEILGAVCTQSLRLLRAILQFLAGQTMRNHNVARTLKFLDEGKCQKHASLKFADTFSDSK